MSITPGFTSVEIREFVHEYQMVKHGQKGVWLTAHGISEEIIRRWRLAVFQGDIDRGLIPREGGVMTISPGERGALQKIRTAERNEHVQEVAKLNARIRELEDISTALGRAIGLLHSLNEQEPSTTPTPSSPSDS
ncbi:MAG: hypothetical protein JJE28_07435 [Actinomycetales bacterium]|nr:hypothetical protein [Actinomycetales bacterium]